MCSLSSGTTKWTLRRMPGLSNAVNRRLWRRLSRAPEEVTGRSVGRPLPASAELSSAARRGLRRHRSRAEALPRARFGRAGARQLLQSQSHTTRCEAASTSKRTSPQWQPPRCSAISCTSLGSG
eukprot:scaffold70209_cov33-Phaeocystis_antarctica.AAC.1